MTTAIKRRRGTTTQHSTFTGLEGEITIDITKDTAVVHDGATAGGRPLLREDLANNTEVVTKTGTQTLTNKTFTSPVINTPTGITKSDISLGNVDNTSDATKNAATATLTNKTITLGANTITGTVAQFQAAVTDGDFATLAGTETLTNKAFNGSLGATTPSTIAGTTITSSALTSGRVTFASTGGLLADNANFVWDNTNARLGIGTASPSYSLVVNKSSAPSDNSTLSIISGATGYAQILLGDTVSDAVSYVAYNNSTNSLEIATNGTEKMRLDSSGNLGLGVTPSAWNTNVKAAQLASGSLYSYSTVDLELTQNCYYNTSNQWIYSTTAQAERYSMYNGQHQWWIAPSGTAGNPITFTQAMTLDASGRLLVGTSTAQRHSREKLEIYNTSGEGLLIRTGDLIYSAIATRSIDSGAGTHYIGYFENSSATNVGTITHNNTNTTYSTSSDYRLKDNIVPMTGALATVAQLKPVTYNWKVNGSNGQGFIAHELQEVVPDCVTGEKDAVNEDGSIRSQGIDTSYLVATLTAAIQEQQAMIDELKAKVAQLEAK